MEDSKVNLSAARQLQRIAVALIVVLTITLATRPAVAGIVQRQLLPAPAPDITLDFAEYSFTGSSGLFSAKGTAISFRETDGSTSPIVLGAYNGVNDLVYGMNWSSMPVLNSTPGQFTLQATIDDSGNLIGTGTFLVRGAEDASSPNIPLLAGTITDLDSSMYTSNGRLYFAATADSGQYFDDGVLNSDVLIKIGSLETGRDFSFTASYLNTNLGTADIGRPVPEPGAMAVWLVGLGGIGLTRRSGRKRADRLQASAI
ncbi:PEP-CTERM sorting domain-containing protein [Rhodopirellula sp. JC639]|uniref:PEP-CTERM sorting domain-containing protein n=1 Tax=Stieleria mannarensis TaxID=2755585 RepID=UPI0016013FDA|nr:PEP-CTERM sorting domain-containing protein [Rhodopirellula sp. JC639]